MNKVGVFDVTVGVSSVSHDLQAQKEYSDQWVKFNQQDKDSVKVCNCYSVMWKNLFIIEDTLNFVTDLIRTVS